MTINDKSPKAICECGDPDCLKGTQLFTPDANAPEVARTTPDAILATLYEDALNHSRKLGYGTVVEALSELERRQTDIPKPVEVAKVISIEGSGTAIAIHPDFKRLPVGSKLYTAPVGTDSTVLDVVAERRRQMEVEGWTPEHDDQHVEGQMASAAGCYAVYAFNHWQISGAPAPWPWEQSWWKPGSPRRNLVKAAALLIAEIQRLDRKGNPFQSHVQEDAQ